MPCILHACSAGKKRADADAQTRDRLSYRTARLREVLTFIINRVSFGKAKGLSRRYSTLLRTTRSAATSAFVNMSRARCVLDISAAGIRSDRAHVRDAFMFLRAMCRRSGLIWAKLEWWFGGHPLHEMNQFISRKYFRGPWQDSLAILILKNTHKMCLTPPALPRHMRRAHQTVSVRPVSIIAFSLPHNKPPTIHSDPHRSPPTEYMPMSTSTGPEITGTTRPLP